MSDANTNDKNKYGGDSLNLPENARTVLIKRYLRKGEDGEPIETIEEMFDRLAKTMAEVENEHGGSYDDLRKKFYDLLTQRKFFPNSPTFTGAGTPLGQLAACFVLPITDDLGKEQGGIFQTLRDAALIQQTGGGNGFSFSKLRPKGDHVKGSAGVASGPISFLRAYDHAFGTIAQGGTRRGANMGVLRVTHPDIEEFIECKAEEGQIANFNISVAITDEFMQCVKDDKDFNLINPRTKEIAKTVRARELFDKIIKYAHHNGEPGALFIDRANATNPVPHLYELEATNPCGEQWLGPYENCCLGSVNLSMHITEDGKVDWEGLKESVRLSAHFLDNVVSANKYVPAVPQLKDAAHRVRRIGLGIMGLGDMMYRIGVRYGSEEGQEFAAQVMEFVRFHAMETSVRLAKERGAFPAIKGSIYDPDNLKWQAPKPIKPYERNWGRPSVNWTEIIDGIKQYGIRNGAQTTIAPTGTIATVAGCESYGCEPVFALAYIRNVMNHKDDSRIQLTYTSPLFEEALNKSSLTEEQKKKAVEIVVAEGSCQGIDFLPENIKHTFVVSSDVTAEEHVRMAGAMQAFVDNSISKTINFPENATEKDVELAYFLSWELGCKGITVYVTGSRDKVVLETNKTKSEKEGKTEPQITEPIKIENGEPSYEKPRPNILVGETRRVETPLGRAYVTINRNGGDEPFEVFLNVGKAGSDIAGVSEALGRLISLILRMPSHITPTERLKNVIGEMKGIGGSSSIGFGPNKVRSLPDGIAKALKSYLGDEEAPAYGAYASAEQHEALPAKGNSKTSGDICKSCGEAAAVEMEGCKRCLSCGYSEC
jgi:ribonucleoside-diphosphate reductase alpha chain